MYSGHTLLMDAGPLMDAGLPNVARHRGFGPFVTWAEYTAAKTERWSTGSLVDSGSTPVPIPPIPRHVPPPGGTPAPEAGGWPSSSPSAPSSSRWGRCLGTPRWAGARWDSITFFVGSIFFTGAAFLQYREMVDAAPAGPPKGWRRYLSLGTRRIDWWATVVQLVGTVFFNVSTANAIRIDLSTGSATHHVWRPDLLGSVCFLVASALAWFEVCHGWGAWQTSSLSWWIVLVNLAGSVAFGVSAIASYIVPETGRVAQRDAHQSRYLRRGAPLPGRSGAAVARANRVPGRLRRVHWGHRSSSQARSK